MPMWSKKLVVLLILFGFPVALVLAWAFDVTPAGVQHTDDAGQPVLRRARHGTWIVALLGGLVAVVAGVGFWWLQRPGLTIAPILYPWRDDPRFSTLVRKIGLPVPATLAKRLLE